MKTHDGLIISAYPLEWPSAWRRTAHRRDGMFGMRRRTQEGTNHFMEKVPIRNGVERIQEQLDSMGVNDNDVVISTNVALRLDGLPRSDQGNPADPGAAVYWRSGKKTNCMASDQYARLADNLAAIAVTLYAMRLIKRHGGSEILDRAFIGFKMLPQPKQWWQVLGLKTDAPTAAEIRAAHISLAKQFHPDLNGANSGGDDWRMARINQARDEGLERIGEAKGAA